MESRPPPATAPNAAAAPRTLEARPSDKAVTAPVTSVSYVSAAARAAANPVAEPVAIDHASYVCVRDLATLQVWIDKARAKAAAETSK